MHLSSIAAEHHLKPLGLLLKLNLAIELLLLLIMQRPLPWYLRKAILLMHM
jgi:hypothetical protein